jgi:hypothetical protein
MSGETRLKRAERYAAVWPDWWGKGQPQSGQPIVHQLPSERDPTVSYDFTDDWCWCPAFTFTGRPCSHMLASWIVDGRRRQGDLPQAPDVWYQRRHASPTKERTKA